MSAGNPHVCSLKSTHAVRHVKLEERFSILEAVSASMIRSWCEEWHNHPMYNPWYWDRGCLRKFGYQLCFCLQSAKVLQTIYCTGIKCVAVFPGCLSTKTDYNLCSKIVYTLPCVTAASVISPNIRVTLRQICSNFVFWFNFPSSNKSILYNKTHRWLGVSVWNELLRHYRDCLCLHRYHHCWKCR